MFIINKKYIVFIVIILVIALVILVNKLFIKPDLSSPEFDINSSDESSVNNSTQNNINGGNGSNIVINPINNAPAYTGRPLNEVRFGIGFNAPETFIARQRKDLNTLAVALNANPISSGGVDNWIAVGVIKKSFNDYEGAKDAWEYAGILYPDNALSFTNLGNLYGFYLHDNEKAELNLKKAITNDPYQLSYYLGLADFYKEVDETKKHKVPEVILSGISMIQDINLYLYLATYYRDLGDKTNAVKYYQEVLKIAPEQAGIKEEIEMLLR